MVVMAALAGSCDQASSEVVIDPDNVVLGKYVTIQNIIVSDGGKVLMPIKKTYPRGIVEVTPNTAQSVWVGGGLRLSDLRLISTENEENYGVAFDVPDQLSWGYRVAGFKNIALPEQDSVQGFYAISTKVMSIYYKTSITEYFNELKRLLEEYSDAEWEELLGYMKGSGVTRETALYAISAKFPYVIVQQFMKKQ